MSRYVNPRDPSPSLNISDLGNRELRLVVDVAVWVFAIGVVVGLIIAHFVHLFR